MSVNTKVNGQLVKSAGLYKASVPIQSGDIYSFEERQVGVWADGKPLYQKTISISALPSTAYTTVNYPHGISNIDKIVEWKGYGRFASGSVTEIPAMQFSNTGATILASFYGQVDATNISIMVGTDRSAMTATFTIRYTKTTDVAGSGEYVPSGDKAVHYSTEEEVIGTWLGETLYRRVFDLGADISIPNNTFAITTIDASTMKTLVDAKAIYSTGETVYNVMANINNNVIRLQADRNDNQISARYIILEYTKTS